MRIGIVAPPFVALPPLKYGGTERVISVLIEELVAAGHDVTVFASGDSQTSAKLVPVVPRALWNERGWIGKDALELTVNAAYDPDFNFDILHNHLDCAPFPVASTFGTPTVTTMHGRQDLAHLAKSYSDYPAMPLVSISNSQRKPVPWANWSSTVYNGIDLEKHPFSPNGGDSLLFIGRISPEKGLDAAIRIALRAELTIRIAAREPLPFTDDPDVKADWDYYEARVKPLLKEPGVEFVGEVDAEGRADLLGSSIALINPIQWDEPFGLVMAEALACGTPVLAMRRGSAPEIVNQGVTGFLGSSEEDLVAAIQRLGETSRLACRLDAEARFSAPAMARNYLQAFENEIDAFARRREASAKRRLHLVTGSVATLPRPVEIGLDDITIPA